MTNNKLNIRRELHESSNHIDHRFQEVDPGPEHNKKQVVKILTDTSQSTDQSEGGVVAIDEINDGFKLIIDELLKDEIARETVEIGVITFGGKVELVQDFTAIETFDMPLLRPNGLTYLAEAVIKGGKHTMNRYEHLKSQSFDVNKPWMVILTDGYPTDSPHVIDMMHKWLRSEENQTVFFPFGTKTADHNFLNSIDVNQNKKMLDECGVNSIRKLFNLLSKSISAASRSTPGQNQITIKL